MGCSPPGSSVHGILQAKLLEWVAIPFSRETSWARDQTWVSCIAGRFFTIWVSKGGYEMPPLEEPLSHPLNLTLRGFLGFPGDSVVKNPPANAGDTGLILGLGRSPGEGNGYPLVFLPGKFHGERSLVGYSPWGHKRDGHDLATEQQQGVS